MRLGLGTPRLEGIAPDTPSSGQISLHHGYSCFWNPSQRQWYGVQNPVCLINRCTAYARYAFIYNKRRGVKNKKTLEQNYIKKKGKKRKQKKRRTIVSFILFLNELTVKGMKWQISKNRACKQKIADPIG